MIPAIDLREIPLGPIRLHPFGTLLVLSIIVGHTLVIRRGRALGLASPAVLEGFAIALGAGALLNGYLAEAFFRRGLASAAGLGGAVATGAIYVIALGLPLLAFADLAAHAFALAWPGARLGGALVHDHLGPASNSWLAVRFATGPRLDMGLCEWLLLPLLIAGAIAAKRWGRPGAVAGAVAAGYASIRFPLDFLREHDPRWAGLTVMQWVCIPLFGLGLALLLIAAQGQPVTREQT